MLPKNQRLLPREARTWIPGKFLPHFHHFLRFSVFILGKSSKSEFLLKKWGWNATFINRNSIKYSLHNILQRIQVYSIIYMHKISNKCNVCESHANISSKEPKTKKKFISNSFLPLLPPHVNTRNVKSHYYSEKSSYHCMIHLIHSAKQHLTKQNNQFYK